MAAFPASRRTIQRTPRRRLLFLLLLLLLAEHSRSRPCPARAVFMHSPAHGRGMCVCAPGDDCIGEACARGPPVPDAVDHGPQKPFETHGRAAFYSPSYTAADVGFPASCIGCRSERTGQGSVMSRWK